MFSYISCCYPASSLLERAALIQSPCCPKQCTVLILQGSCYFWARPAAFVVCKKITQEIHNITTLDIISSLKTWLEAVMACSQCFVHYFVFSHNFPVFLDTILARCQSERFSCKPQFYSTLFCFCKNNGTYPAEQYKRRKDVDMQVFGGVQQYRCVSESTWDGYGEGVHHC